MNSYELSRDFFDWSYENTGLVNTNHVALYFFIIEHNNRLGWKPRFGLPMQMAMDAIGVKNYRTWSKAFNDLIGWGFIKLYQKSQNQYSANIIGLVKNTKSTTKSLTKATLNHLQKQSQKQVHGIVCIDKPNNIKPDNLITYYDTSFLNLEKENIKISISEFEKLCKIESQEIIEKAIKLFSDYKIEKNPKTKSDYLTIKRWVIDAVKEKINKTKKIQDGPEPTIGGIPISETAKFFGTSTDELLKFTRDGG